jgi:hypothetical protein
MLSFGLKTIQSFKTSKLVLVCKENGCLFTGIGGIFQFLRFRMPNQMVLLRHLMLSEQQILKSRSSVL